MGIGILEPKQAVVPGTIQLFDSQLEEADTSHLKHSADGKTILAPQPSDSPNDPLNWPLHKKDLIFLVVLFDSILSGIHGPMLAPVTVELAVEFNVSLTASAQLGTYMLLLISGIAYIDAALANIYGKRAIFVVSMAILMASDAWGARATSYNSLLGARMLSGVGQAALECLTASIVPDLYFVHQRSRRVMAFLLFSGSGVFLGVVIAGQIAAVASWRNIFIGLAVAEGVMLLMTFLFFHEPAYKREHVDPLAHLSGQAIAEKVEATEIHEVSATTPSALESSHHPEQLKTFLQNLNLYQGRFSQNNLLHLLYRSFILTFHPTIFWAGTVTFLLAWSVGCSFTIAAFMIVPPYNFSTGAVGNMYLGPWIGLVIALLVGEPIFRWVAMKLTKLNQNIYEPEFRLFHIIPGVILGIIGCVGWGWGEQNTISWGALVFFFALIVAGAVLVNSGAINYILDAHREFSNESQVILFAMKVWSLSDVNDLLEFFQLRYGLLFCRLVGICRPEDRLEHRCGFIHCMCFGRSVCLLLREENARLLEPAQIHGNPRSQT